MNGAGRRTGGVNDVGDTLFLLIVILDHLIWSNALLANATPMYCVLQAM